MGNHSAGRAMAHAAELLKDRRRPGETAIELLDKICEEYHGCDAEFDDSARPGEALGDLMIEAFAPEFDPDDDEDGGTFYETVWCPFNARYGFC